MARARAKLLEKGIVRELMQIDFFFTAVCNETFDEPDMAIQLEYLDSQIVE